MHAWPVGHALLQVPQWIESVCRSTQRIAAGQNVVAGVQMHPPRAHARPEGHAVPHAPQLFASVWRSTQRPRAGQKASAALEQVHRPAMHAWPAGHAVPHVPQLAASSCRSTQRLMAEQYERSPAPGQTQRPPVHDWPAMHTLPQAPQLFGSVIRLEHPRPGQNSCPAGHPCRHTATAVAPPSGTPASPAAPDVAVQAWPGAHRVPQRPQLRASVRRSTHALSQTSGSLAGHRRQTLRAETPPSKPTSALQTCPPTQPRDGRRIAASSSGRQHR